MSRSIGWLTIVAVLCAGCGGPKEPASSSGPDAKSRTTPPAVSKSDGEVASAQVKTAPAAQPADPPVPADIRRDSLPGNWMLYLSQRGNDFPIALFTIAKREGEPALQATLVESTPALPNPALESATISGDTADLQLKVREGDQEMAVSFEGRLADGIVLGNVLFDNGNMNPAWLKATEAKSVAGLQRESSGGREEFEKAFGAEDSVDAMRKFGQAHSQSPLSLLAYQQILQTAKEKELPADTVSDVVREYFAAAAKWGSRMEQQSGVNAGLSLARSNYLPELATKILKTVQEKLTEKSPGHWKTDVERELLVLALTAGSEDEKKQAAEALAERQKQDAFDHRIALALADHAEQSGQIAQAIEQNARVAVLPTLEEIVAQEWLAEGTVKPLPSETVARLWKKEHGTTDGLDDYLHGVYEKTIYSFATDKVEARPADGSRRVALVELFTGAQCPPCVAADVATGGLEATYPRTDVIVLRYHQHIPGPDPLSNAATEARFAYYQGMGTPTVAINGEVVEGYGGYLQQSTAAYQRLREGVSQALQKQSSINLKLSANAANGELTLSATAAGPDKPDENLRLRLVLAEDKIDYIAPNGIRVHEMVVRDMPTGPAGVPPKDGQLAFSATSSLAELKQQLIDYLSNYEQGKGVQFPVKPLDLDKLHLVALVQNDATKEILQAAAVPVTGTIEYPAGLKATKASPEFDDPTRLPERPGATKPADSAPKPPAE